MFFLTLIVVLIFAGFVAASIFLPLAALIALTAAALAAIIPIQWLAKARDQAGSRGAGAVGWFFTAVLLMAVALEWITYGLIQAFGNP